MNSTYDVAVVGAGPAGSAAAISASARGLRVLLLESGQFPRHKVCGEFVSAEAAGVIRFLLRADAEPLLNAPRITTSRLHSGGKSVCIPLNPPAYSIPRFVLDEYLWKSAGQHGVACRMATAARVSGDGVGFKIVTDVGEFSARHVINASGRWSKLSRRIAACHGAWIGLKAHFEGETEDTVDLYFLKGGYCGVQPVSPGILNACALVRQGTAKTLEQVFARDPELACRARLWRRTTELFATAPVYLGAGLPLSDGMLQVGDAAGFVDPFVGDGISLALRSGVLAGRCIGVVPAEEYARLYREAFRDIFRNTRQVRSLVALARPLRPLLIKAFETPAVSNWIFHRTRNSSLDVLSEKLSS